MIDNKLSGIMMFYGIAIIISGGISLSLFLGAFFGNDKLLMPSAIFFGILCWLVFGVKL